MIICVWSTDHAKNVRTHTGHTVFQTRVNFMKNLTTHKNWLREEITPPLLRRTGERVNRLQRDWNRDFGIQSLARDKAWTLWYNTHSYRPFKRVLDEWRRTGMQVTVEVRET